jgi:hypothetical protein
LVVKYNWLRSLVPRGCEYWKSQVFGANRVSIGGLHESANRISTMAIDACSGQIWGDTKYSLEWARYDAFLDQQCLTPIFYQ